MFYTLVSFAMVVSLETGLLFFIGFIASMYFFVF